MEKNEIVTIEITDLTSEGEGIGRVGAFPLFVKDACIGDVVECSVMKLKKNFGYARLLRVVTPGASRITPRCLRARSCGGCQLQQMDYQAELQFKTRKARENLRRIGGFDAATDHFEFNSCIGMEDPWRYRNKAQVPFGYDRNGKLVAGFYAGRTHDIIDMEDCALAPLEAAEAVRMTKALMERFQIRAYDETNGSGLIRHLLFRKAFTTGEVMICLVINGQKLPHAEEFTEAYGKITGFQTFCLNINTENTNVILGRESKTIFGPGYIEDYIGDIKFRISSNSFFQVNPLQTAVLYGRALEYAGLQGNENVWDLYCGIGTISLFLARKAKKVYGVEIVPQAITDARENASLNEISNAEFFTGAAEEVLPEWYATHPEEKIDVVSVDPPRKGCDEKCLDTIGRMSPEKIVYVSCDSATLARDLRILREHYGYRLEKVQPVDMFPWTVHVETVVLLSKGVVCKNE